MVKVYGSIAAADPADLASAVRVLEAAGVDAIHLDIEDGVFVPNITFGWSTVAALRPLTALPFDVHLMVARPEDHLEQVFRAGVQRVAVHVEACPYPRRIVERLRHAGIVAGLALNPAGSLDALAPALDCVEFVLLLLNEYDGRGNRLIPAMLGKLRRLAELARVHGFEIVADGGIGPNNVAKVVAAGADAVVVGRALFGAAEPERVVRELRDRADTWKHGTASHNEPGNSGGRTDDESYTRQ